MLITDWDGNKLKCGNLSSQLIDQRKMEIWVKKLESVKMLKFNREGF